MKKSLVLFIGMFLCGLVAMCVLPGYILKEADRVKITEQVLFGDKALVEGVTVQTVNDSMKHLFWNTEYVIGKEPVTKTKYEFSASRRTSGVPMLIEQSWAAQSEHNCLMLMNRLHGGWSSSSTAGINLDTKSTITDRGIAEAYKELAEETNPGEEKEKQIFLSDYMEYYPVTVSLDTVWEDDSLSEGYSEFFKIPVPESVMYTISLEKNEDGEITRVGGRECGQNIFNWNSVSARSETDCYFTFERFLQDGTTVDTGMIPGGYGIYRQPYTLKPGEIIMDASELSMVYSLEDETYPYGRIFLDVNAAGQLLIVTDTESATKLQVVDTVTMECIQKMEVPRPGESKFFELVWIDDEILLFAYSGGFFCLIDWNMERGYEHQFTMQLKEEDKIYPNYYVQYNDMDWNGKQLLYASCYNINTGNAGCDFRLLVYDATGKVYEGTYSASLLTEQEREPYSYSEYRKCQPWGEAPLQVFWPET